MNERNSRFVIEAKRNKYKLQLIGELLHQINTICDEKKIQYFAVDELLSLYTQGEDSYMDHYDYKIALFHDSYRIIKKELETRFSKENQGIRFDQENYASMIIDYPRLILKRSFPEEVGSKDVTVTLSLMPLSYLPMDEKKREAYLHKMSQRYVSRRKKCTMEIKALSTLLKKKSFSNTYKKYARNLSSCLKDSEKYKDSSYACKVEQKLEPVIPVTEIKPIKKVEFLSGSLMVPAKTEAFEYMEDEAVKKRLHEIQARALKQFDLVCQEQGIDYFAAKDLLIEIMTDGEYPKKRQPVWAVGLLRKDYDRVISVLGDRAKAQGILLKNHRDDYPDVTDLTKRFILQEDASLSCSGMIPGIEILPYDKVPYDYEEAFKHKKRVRKLLADYKRLFGKEIGTVLSSGSPIKTIEECMEKIRTEAGRYNAAKDPVKLFEAVTETGKNIPANELYPTQRRSWEDMTLSLPYNPYVWADEKDAGYTEYLMQGKTEVLKKIDRMCEQEKIPYFATADLLVGAYVYHDVIPKGGTKSASIGMLRADFEHFLQVLRENGSRYGLQLSEYRDPAHKYPLLTKYVTLEGRGDWLRMVRLHPYDKVPASFYTKKAFLDKIKEYNKEYEELINFKVDTVSKYKEIYSPQEMNALKKKYASMNPMEYAQMLDNYAQKYNEDTQPEGYQRVAFAFSGKVVNADSIAHTRKIPFRDMELTCLGDLTPWYEPMDEDLSYQIKTLQRENKKLIREFDRVCQEIGVGYFICAGTLIGYLRHGGFIPWDDDVDMGMLREDYDKLLAEGPKYFGEDFFLQTRESDPNIPYVYSKLRLNNTVYHTEYTEKRDMHKGIGLDIFPFDYVPNDRKVREKLIKDVTKLSQEHNFIARNQYPEMETPFPPRNEEEQKIEDQEKAMIAEYWKKSLKDSQNAYLAKATSYNALAKKQNLKTVASFVISYTCINVEDLLPYQRGMFEDIEVSLPKYPHALMSMQYGDYMQFPLKHQQVSHKLVRWQAGEDGSDRKPPIA